jgi:hypothetical protein
MKAYHGSNKMIERFDRDFSAQGVFWFSLDKVKIISGNSGASSTKYLIEVDLKINNPAGWEEYEKLGLGQIRELGFDSVLLDDDYIIFDSDRITITGIVKLK